MNKDSGKNQDDRKKYWKRISHNQDLFIESVGNVDKVAFMIEREPNPKCGDCYGKGYLGYDVLRKRVSPCPCVKGWMLVKIGEAKEGSILMLFDGTIAIAYNEDVSEKA